MALLSCKDNRTKEYEKIVSQTARFKIHFLPEKKTFFLRQNEVEQFKQVLTSEIRPDTVSSFMADTRIELIGSDFQQIGVIALIHNSRPTASFNSEKLKFGFRLTYRIGMWVSEMRSRK